MFKIVYKYEIHDIIIITHIPTVRVVAAFISSLLSSLSWSGFRPSSPVYLLDGWPSQTCNCVLHHRMRTWVCTSNILGLHNDQHSLDVAGTQRLFLLLTFTASGSFVVLGRSWGVSKNGNFQKNKNKNPFFLLQPQREGSCRLLP